MCLLHKSLATIFGGSAVRSTAGGSAARRARRLAGPVVGGFLALSQLVLLLLGAGRANAQTDYKWQVTTSGGLWSTGTNWSPTGPASGATNTADFGTLVLPANNTVHLDASFTI